MILNIEYMGCAMSGRATSMTAVVNNSEAVEMIEQNLFAVTWHRQRLRVGCLRRHAQLNIKGAHKDPMARRELERLREAQGIIFVLDSQAERLEANVEAFEGLVEQFSFLHRSLVDFPLVFQANKRDLSDVVDMETLRNSLNVKGHKWVETIAVRGLGVFEAFDELLKSSGIPS